MYAYRLGCLWVSELTINKNIQTETGGAPIRNTAAGGEVIYQVILSGDQ